MKDAKPFNNYVLAKIYNFVIILGVSTYKKLLLRYYLDNHRNSSPT